MRAATSKTGAARLLIAKGSPGFPESCPNRPMPGLACLLFPPSRRDEVCQMVFCDLAPSPPPSVCSWRYKSGHTTTAAGTLAVVKLCTSSTLYARPKWGWRANGNPRRARCTCRRKGERGIRERGASCRRQSATALRLRSSIAVATAWLLASVAGLYARRRWMSRLQENRGFL